MTDTKLTATEILHGYKGHDKDLKCRGMQFEVGKTYEIPAGTAPVRCGKVGFHWCANPMDVWLYYGVAESRFTRIVAEGPHSKDDSDSKVASASMVIEAEISLPDFIGAAIDWVIDATKGKGYNSQHASSGHYSQHASSGDFSRHASSGHDSRHASSGNNSRHASSGNNSRHASSGDLSRIETSGECSVIASAGRATRARGKAGTWISLAEFDDNGKCVGFATGCIGHDGLEENVWYVARGGKLIEAG